MIQGRSEPNPRCCFIPALRYGQEYLDIGEEAYEQRHQHRALASVAARAADLGYDLVSRESETAAAAA